MNGINNNIAFRGALGDKFVQEITVHRRSVAPATLLQEAKGKLFGLDTGKVGDIFESFISGLIREITENQSLRNRITTLKIEMAESVDEAINSTRKNLVADFRKELDAKDKTIQECRSRIAELEIYKEMAHVKSIEELDTVMPETAIATVKEMAEHKAEAEESMLTYLLTGQGQEKALEQAERAQILVKATNDGITNIPEVAEIIKDNDMYFAETRCFLTRIMRDVLRKEKASVVIAPVFKEQIKKNMLGLLTPYANERYYNCSRDFIVRETDSILDSSVTFHTKLYQRKKAIKKDIPNAAQIVYNGENNNIETYDSNGKMIDTRYFIY